MPNTPTNHPNAVPQLAMGQVRHVRLRPARHALQHPTYFLLLPMRAGREHGLGLPRSKWGWMTFSDRDHGDGCDDALLWIENLLKSEGIHEATGQIWLQTYPRVLGHAFKPVSFWYAHRPDGSLAAIVAEVNNTFGERHCYLLKTEDLAWGKDLEAEKVFHVSPFCKTEGRYRFRFMRTANRIVARVDLFDDEGLLLQTSMSGELKPLTPARIRQALLSMPMMTLGVVFHIHVHALRLWLKRVPFFHKPPAPERFVTR